MGKVRVEFLTGVCLTCKRFTSQVEVGNKRICAEHEAARYAEIERKVKAAHASPKQR